MVPVWIVVVILMLPLIGTVPDDRRQVVQELFLRSLAREGENPISFRTHSVEFIGFVSDVKFLFLRNFLKRIRWNSHKILTIIGF